MSNIIKIDVESIVKAKAGKKARYIPKFVISYLKKIIHQDEVNVALDNFGHKEGLDFVSAFMEYFNNSFEVHGLENLPHDDRRYTFVSNHPLGAQDGLGLAHILGPVYDGKIKFLKDITISFLAQDNVYDPDLTIWEVVSPMQSIARNMKLMKSFSP